MAAEWGMAGLVVVMGLAWGGLDASRKALADKLAPAPLVAVITSGIALMFAGWVALSPEIYLADGYWPWAALNIFLNIAANIFFMRAMMVSPMSIVVPILSFTPVFTALLAIPVLGEWPGPWQVGGIALVVGGALFLNLGPGEWRHPLRVFAALARERGAAWMLATALIWSITPAIDKICVMDNGFASLEIHALVQLLGISGALLIYLGFRGQLGQLRGVLRHKRQAAWAMVFGAVAMALQLHAFKIGFVAVVEAAKRGIGMVLSVVNGRLLFGEPISAAKSLAVALMTAGVCLILLG